MENAQWDVVFDTVLPRYGVRTKGIIPQGPHTCLVDTDRGIKRLRIDADEVRLRRRHELWDHLAKQGFRRVPRHIHTLYGEPYVKLRDVLYTLSDDWEGRAPHGSPLDMRLAGRNLAHLHLAARGLQLDDEIALPKRHGTWLAKFGKAGDDLREKQLHWTELGSRDALQTCFLNEFGWIAEQIGRAVEGLVAARYEEHARRSEQEGTFAVGDYRLTDLRIDPEGRVATLSIDEAVADLPLYDAAKFAHGLIERGEHDLAQLFLDAYAESAGLAQQDVVILDAYLTFPHAAYRHVMQYLRMKKGADVFAQRLEQAVRDGQTRRPVLYGADSVRWV